jgi:hypothetical protein
MLPSQLKPTDFAAYPPQARGIATGNLALLQQLPLAFTGVLLREIIVYDWRFPAERHQLEEQLRVLSALTKPELATRMQGFAAINLSPELERTNWVANPSGFMEQLTAHLWSTHQMDSFRATADTFATFLAQAAPTPRPAMRRLGIVVVGKDVQQTDYPLFRKLRPHGVHLTKIKPEGGLDILLTAASKRAGSQTSTPSQPTSADYAHWYIDGGVAAPAESFTQVSYDALQQPRTQLLNRTQQAIESVGMGPEALRSMLAQMKPEDVGLNDRTGDPTLNRFKLSLLTEGSGTQIFSTTFVQWAARECLRRAQPLTLFLRYAPRQEQQPMNAMLSGAKAGAPDPQGSLVDADMGAYYTWLNMNRLSGADQMSFLVWFEGHSEGLAIGPGLPQGTTSSSPMDLHQVVELLG